MATGHGGDEGGGWWGGWLETAKQKSAVAFEQMRKDLGEFGSTIQRDTSTMVASSAGVIRESMQTEDDDSSTSSRVKQGFSDLLSGLSESLAPRKAEGEETASVPSRSTQHIFDRAKARLHAMQTDAATYCSEPDGPREAYEEWLVTFDTDAYKGDISDLLVANTDVRAIYTKLVPAAVSNADFWGRYFYKVQQLDRDEARRAALKVRADMTSSQTLEEEAFQWDDDEEEALEEEQEQQEEVDREERSAPGASRREDTARVPPLPGSDDEDSSDDGTAEKLMELRLPQQHEAEPPTLTTGQSPRQSSPPPDSPPPASAGDQPQPGPAEDGWTARPMAPTPDVSSNTDATADEPPSPPSPSQPSGEVPEAAGDQTAGDATTDRRPSEDEEEEDGTKVSGEVQEGATKPGPLQICVPPARQDDGEDSDDKKQSPSGSDASNKESSLSDDWEKDFDDIDVTPEDLEAAAVSTKTRPTGDPDDVLDDDLDDWESWE